MRTLFAFLLAAAPTIAGEVESFLSDRCTSCHNAASKKGRLDLEALKPGDPAWVKVYDRVRAGEMPPAKSAQPEPAERETFTATLKAALTQAEQARYAAEGRSVTRRLNRYEYESALRDLLGAPWLQLRDRLPEDGTAHGYNKLGDALDMSHVQMTRYLDAADVALHSAATPMPKSKTVRYYARDQASFTGRMTFSQFNQAPERATFPTLGSAGQPEVRAKTAPMTDPKHRDLEGVGLVCGAYEPVEPKFAGFKAPASGRYKLRLHGHTVWVGPNGTSGKTKNWFIPDFDRISAGRRSEPITLHAEIPPRQLRQLGTVDFTPDAATVELEVDLQAGETIRPDAARLFRSRPGEVRFQNPLAEKDGQPGVVYRWLEVEGPLPAKTLPLFDGQDPKELLAKFARRTYRRPVSDAEALRFLPVIGARLNAGSTFQEAMIAGYTAVLCSPEFLTVIERPGRLDDHALATRLALLLWNSEPDAALRRLAADGTLHEPAVLRAQTDRLLADPKSRRFVEAFLDYWLDLRKIAANSPDAVLYSDYYLDDWLDDSALEETRLYFAEMVKSNLPARAIIDSDFAIVNERLAAHYGLPRFEGSAFRKVALPKDSVRGGLLTQASVLMVTANGTTTSPVLRGAWIVERILGQPSPPPPPVPAVEPDLRGTVTIREQLARHRDQASCAACHARIDPPGFALESFDVMGAFRTNYRALHVGQDRAPGLGKNGQPLGFKWALPVDAAGELPDGRKFSDVREFKKLLLASEDQVARNLVRQLSIFATGAPVGFRDRDAIESILKQSHNTRDIIHNLIASDLFQTK